MMSTSVAHHDGHTGKPAPRMRHTTWWRSVAQGLSTLCLPPACAVCRSPRSAAYVSEFRRAGDGVGVGVGVTTNIVCSICVARIRRLADPVCARCGHPRLSANAPLPAGGASTGSPDEIPPCRWCARLPHFVRAARSVCRMDDGSGAAFVHALKYGGWSAVATPMAAAMARLPFPDDVRDERTALVPMPLSRTRERERGYNQAERLATELAIRWEIPVWRNVVSRIRHTRSQVQLTPSERVSNVSGAFSPVESAKERLQGSHIVLVDDVITTAASLNAAAQALTAGGARIISYITFGRAPDTGDRSTSDFDFDQD